MACFMTNMSKGDALAAQSMLTMVSPALEATVSTVMRPSTAAGNFMS